MTILNTSRFVSLCAYAGIIGPIFFGTMLVSLTFIKYNFLLSLGWDPLHAPTFDWPSGLALGRLGWLMTATFLLSGAMMTLFAIGLCVTLREQSDRRVSPLGFVMYTLAGLAMMGLAFTTDPTIRSTPATWHGRLHDLSFVLLGLSLMAAMIVLGFVFHRKEHWENLALYTWGTALFVLPTFYIKGAAFYVFLLAVFLWSEAVAWKLRQNT